MERDGVTTVKAFEFDGKLFKTEEDILVYCKERAVDNIKKFVLVPDKNISSS